MLPLGFAVPSFLLCDAEPRQTGEVVIVNNNEGDFAGTLRLDVPDGFAVTPVETPVK